MEALFAARYQLSPKEIVSEMNRGGHTTDYNGGLSSNL
jgi:hypothetical protein